MKRLFDVCSFVLLVASVNFFADLANATTRATVCQEENHKDLEALFERGMSVFKSGDQNTDVTMAEAAATLDKVVNHPEVSATQKYSAAFYRTCALANAKMYKEALQSGKDFQNEFGVGPELMQYLISEAKWKLGNRDEARKELKAFLKKNPKSPLRLNIQILLGEPVDGVAGASVSRFPPAKQLPFATNAEAKKFNKGQKDGYMVVTVGLETENVDHQKFKEVALRVKEFHKAELLSFDGTDFQVLRREISKRQPAYVMFVIPPRLLDVNFHREIFRIAPTLDNDLFVDFTWGYLTGRDGNAVEEFWNRIEKLHTKGLTKNYWLETAVSKGRSHTVDRKIPAEAITAGFTGKQIYFGIAKEPDPIQFANDNIDELENAAVIAMTGNGDPQGIWLFDDHRNADRTKHWEFDKTKVGQDPDNEMTRLKADWFANLKLNSPIIWSGTCHSGACYRVYVEGDIVSTFGTSETTEVYEMPADESLCLSLLDAGAGSLLVPIASNHGMSVSMETRFILQNGASLGEAIKSTHDDVLLQADGVPTLVTQRKGDRASYYSEPIMQSGGANRALIGDPSLSLFKKTEIPTEQVEIESDAKKKTVAVSLTWEPEAPFHPMEWNMYADGRGFSRRMKARVDCSDLSEDIRQSIQNGTLNVTATVMNNEGEKIECHALASGESFCGKTFLHLQASADDDSLSREKHVAKFVITWK